MAITANIIGQSVQLTGNPIYINCTGASVPAGASDYKILLKVISEDGKLEGAPFIDAIAPDAAGEALFNISGYVDQPVKKKFQFPASGVYVAYPTQAFNVQVQPGEFYIDSNGDPVENWFTTSGIVQMLKGGTNPRQIAVMADAGKSFYNMYVEGDKFLSARPWGEEVHPDQNIKLWYIVAANISANLVVRTVFDDSSEEVFTSDPIALDKDNLYEFNCNPSLHGINLEPAGKKASFFDVYLDFGTSTSQSRRFTFDWRYCERPIFLYFANSLGGIDDVFFSGNIKDRFETVGEISEIPPQYGDTVFDPTLVPTGRNGQNKWTFNTGWKPFVSDMQYYRDLMLAQQAWYQYSNLSQTTYSIIPIIIDNADKVIANREKDMFSMELTVSEAHRSPFAFDNRSF